MPWIGLCKNAGSLCALPLLCDPLIHLPFFFFSCLKNGELIYGSGDAQSPAADLKELAYHLKPFFFPSNGLASGPHCTRAVIRELVHVITRVLLSSSDKGRAPGALRLGLQGPRVCEASPFSRSLHHQGRAWPSPGGLWGIQIHRDSPSPWVARVAPTQCPLCPRLASWHLWGYHPVLRGFYRMRLS